MNTEGLLTALKDDQILKLLEAAADHFLVLDKNGRVVYVNHYNIQPNIEVLGSNWFDWIAPADKVAAKLVFSEAISSKKTTVTECRLLAGTEDNIWAEAKFSALSIAEKELIALFVTNITKKKLTQEFEKQQLLRTNQLLKCINRINASLVKDLTVNELLASVSSNLVEFSLVQMSWIGWVNDLTLKVEPLAVYGDQFNYVNTIEVYADNRPEGQGPIGIAIRSGESVITQNAITDPLLSVWVEKLKKTTWKSACAIPIKIHGKNQAVLTIYTDYINFFGSNEISMLEAVVKNLEIVIESKFAKDLLKASKENLRAIIEAEPECVKVVAHTGELLEMNSVGLAMLEVDSLEEVQRHSLKNFVLPKYHQAFGELHQQVIAGQKGKLIFEIVGLRGTHRWVETHAVPFAGQGNQAVRLLSVTRDITEQKEHEMRTQESAHFFDSLANNVPGLLAYWSKDLICKFSNTQYLEWFNHTKEQMVGIRLQDLLGETLFKKNEPYVRAVLRGEKQEFERQLTKVNGENHVTWAQYSPHFVNNEVIGFFALVTDITRLKQAEQQVSHVSKISSLGEMAAGIAHEINNPLTIILGAANQLHKFANDPEKWQSRVDSIGKASERISKIIAGLKKYSHSAAEVQLKNKSLSEIVSEAMVLTQLITLKHRVVIDFEMISTDQILCNELEIEQVIINLISNSVDAIKTFSERWIKISVTEESNSILLRITDSGNGIPKLILDKIFDPFFTTKSVGEGTGLGLSITKGILDRHKATISIATNSPKTCFELRFQKALTEVAKEPAK